MGGRLPLAVTMGDPAGIGPDITLMAHAALRRRGPVFFLIDDPGRVAALAAGLGLPVAVRGIAAPGEAQSVFPEALPVLAHAVPGPVLAGQPDPARTPAILGAIARAVTLVRAGEAAGVVTNPIHKESLYAGGFTFPGHTEYLGALTGVAHPVMLLCVPGLRVVPVSVHEPLAAAIAGLTTARIVDTGRVVLAALRQDFGLAQPRLAVAGLNPHAGEGGSLGTEERDIIAPAIAALRAGGALVTGPHPPDTLFHAAARARYDAALCMYHDQALIPLKTLDFERGVNVTLGLPIVRTSPDHGTAFDIAGTGRASPASLIAALELAAAIVQTRSAGG